MKSKTTEFITVEGPYLTVTKNVHYITTYNTSVHQEWVTDASVQHILGALISSPTSQKLFMYTNKEYKAKKN